MYVHTLRIYLALTVQCVKENDQAIKEDDGITVSCPLISHSLIDDVSVTIGESTLDRQSQVLPLKNTNTTNHVSCIYIYTYKYPHSKTL